MKDDIIKFICENLMILSIALPVFFAISFTVYAMYKAEIIDVVDNEDDFIDQLKDYQA